MNAILALPARLRLALTLVIGVATIWSLALYDLDRSRASEQRESEQITIFQAQAFAENARSTIKRINEIALDLRSYWAGNRAGFADIVRRRQEHSADVAFQVAVIGADGYLEYSNLASGGGRMFLGEREHFRVHSGAPGRDRLFISKPVLGKVSGKWSIQFTRPIFGPTGFAGVIVISVSPHSFAEFGQNNVLRSYEVSAMVASGGEIMARHPNLEKYVGKTLSNTPFQSRGEIPLSGHYRRIAQTDGAERIYGYFRIPEYELNFVVGRTMERALAPYFAHRRVVLAVTSLVTVLVVLLLVLQLRANAAREEMERKLRRSQSMLWSAVEAVGEAFVIYDEDDRLAYCNDQCRAYHGKSADLLVPGRPYQEILRLGAERGQYPAAVGRVDAWVAEALAAHRSGNTVVIQKTDSGRWLRVLDRITPEGFRVGFRIDITELYEAKDAAESANRAKSDFLANMSHEIRTPLNGMLGMAQVLLAPELAEQERIDCARIILRSGQTLLALLNDILDIAKVEAGMVRLELAACSPVELIRESAQLFAAAAHLKQQEIEVASTLPAERHYLADPNRLRQMLANLIGNAIKFSERGVIKVEVRQIEADQGGALLEFAVIDSGVGIAEQDFARLFEPFSQLDSSATRPHGGTGLGLSIVRKLARLMGGDAGLTSELGRGSRFWFRIRAGFGAALAAPASDAEQARRSPLRLRGHVLVADDDVIHRKVSQLILAQHGLSCRLCENGRQAVEAVESGEQFDLILMDIAMPVRDGHGALEQIRRWQTAHGLRACPVVAITANAFDEDRQRCLTAGMDDFIAKPIAFQTLGQLLAKWLPADRPAAPEGAVPTPAESTLATPMPAAPAPAAPTPAAPDWDLLACIIEQALPLLEQRRFDAFGRFKALKAAVANTELACEVDDIEKALNAMQFEQVSERLRQLAHRRGRSLSA
ncbi:MAG: response regulator [Burkholderiaceae bacterium]|nr:response regulator [Burkholderiaceae bacterium]